MPLIIPLLIPPEQVSNDQWNQLVAIINAEMNVGPGGPGTGTNPTGRLQQVNYCHQSADMWTGLYPAIAVQLLESPESNVGTHRHEIKSLFQIVAATVSKSKAGSDGTPIPANLDDAMGQLKTIISDGAGNGISAVLRDRLNYTLGGRAYQTRITNWKFSWILDAGDEQDAAVAYATCQYTAWQRIDI